MEDKESKIKYLKSKGWNYLLTEDNWVDGNKVYNLPDWMGLSLEDAFNYVKNNESLFTDINSDNKNVMVINKCKNKSSENFLVGEILQKVRQQTMDGVIYEQYVVKTKYGISSYFIHEIVKPNKYQELNYN